MNKTKIVFVILFLVTLKYSYSQDMDSSLIKFNSKLMIYLDYCSQSIHTKEEMDCFINSNEPSIKTKFLGKENFNNYVFISCSIDLNENNVQNFPQKNCTYRINMNNSNYVIAFDIKHKKAYKLRGFCNSSEFKQFYADYLYLENKDKIRKKVRQRKYFLKTHKIENVDLEVLWKIYM